ncbi:hypothetical protein [Photobacterium sp. 1_MG-2023]|uniref:hypothetical protein n=1 Tax=Photobacterium sp. 1_MG-2023 TaxID=3062646 RepID=UPI0026E2312D|nr:hypothetical protein [Photobacterium sp. 1_MG-2023]MDO6708420.1 hypothetical protein [Photobacterium sp. 1_MG-2023]
MRKLLLSVVVTAAILTGCGGSDSDKDQRQSVQVTVIDGYLSDAQVCVDRNRNGHCDTGELLTEKTNGNGQITISASDSQSPLIARVIAGESSDSDHPGFVWQDAELYAPAGQTILSPFSTLAYLNGQSLADYAASLNLDANLLSQDYVALKSSNPDAKKVHLYARTMNAMLGATLSENDLEGQKIWIQNLKSKIQKLENNQVDFDTVTLTLGKNGQFSHSDRVKGIQLFLEGHGTMFLDFLNVSETIPHRLVFQDGKIAESSLNFVRSDAPYEVSDTSMKIAADLENEIEFVYVTPDIALAYLHVFESRKYLIFWYNETDFFDETTDLTLDDFVGQTWYFLQDAAEPGSKHNEPYVPELNELTFISETRVMINPTDSAAYEADWGFTSNPEGNQTLTIHFGNENPMILGTEESKGGVTLLYKEGLLHSVLMTQNKVLAKALFNQWQ